MLWEISQFRIVQMAFFDQLEIKARKQATSWLMWNRSNDIFYVFWLDSIQWQGNVQYCVFVYNIKFVKEKKEKLWARNYILQRETYVQHVRHIFHGGTSETFLSLPSYLSVEQTNRAFEGQVFSSWALQVRRLVTFTRFHVGPFPKLSSRQDWQQGDLWY